MFVSEFVRVDAFETIDGFHGELSSDLGNFLLLQRNNAGAISPGPNRVCQGGLPSFVTASFAWSAEASASTCKIGKLGAPEYVHPRSSRHHGGAEAFVPSHSLSTKASIWLPTSKFSWKDNAWQLMRPSR